MTVEDFNKNYQSGVTWKQSGYFRPSDLGHLDDESHHIAYSPQSSIAWYRSKLRKIKSDTSYETVFSKVREDVKRQEAEDSVAYLTGIYKQVVQTINRWGMEYEREDIEPKFVERESDTRKAAAGEVVVPFREDEIIKAGLYEPIPYREEDFPQLPALVRNFLGCELFILGTKPSLRH